MNSIIKLIITLFIVHYSNQTTITSIRGVYISYTPATVGQYEYHTLHYTYSNTAISLPATSTTQINSSNWKTLKIITTSQTSQVLNFQDTISYSRFQRYLILNHSSTNYVVVWNETFSDAESCSHSSGDINLVFKVRYFYCSDKATTFYTSLSNTVPKAIIKSNGNIESSNLGFVNDSSAMIIDIGSDNNFGLIVKGDATKIAAACVVN